MNHLLRQAEAAIKYVENEVRYGAPNKAEDIFRVRAASETTIWPADAPRDRSMMVARVNEPEVKRLLEGNIESSVTRMRELATMTKREGVGTCSGMSAVAFDYLRGKGAWGLAVFGVEGCDHALVVLGLYKEPPEQEVLPEHDPPESWNRDAVVCDPWYHEWFVVSEWYRRGPHILRYTLRGRPRPARVRMKCLAYAA